MSTAEIPSGVRAPLVESHCMKNLYNLYILSEPLSFWWISQQFLATWLLERNTNLDHSSLLSETRANTEYLIWVHETSMCFVPRWEQSLSLSLLLIFLLTAWTQSPTQPCCLVALGWFYNTTTHFKCQPLWLTKSAPSSTALRTFHFIPTDKTSIKV